MKSGDRKSGGNVGRQSVLLASIVMAFALGGCASKSGKDQLSYDGPYGRGGAAAARAGDGHGGQSEFDGRSGAAAARAGDGRGGQSGFDTRDGVVGQWSGDGVEGAELAAGGGKGRSRHAGKGLSGSYESDAVKPGNEWEHALLPGMDLDDSSPSLLADRVAAARAHARDVARESEDPQMYAAVTGGRDLYEDLATEYALSPDRLRDLKADYAANPQRDIERRGFFEEEAYAFGENLSSAERLAARVEAARRRAGLGETTEETVTAFASGAYSRVYERDDVGLAGSLLADGTAGGAGGRGDSLGTGGMRGGKSARGRGRDGAVDVAMADANVNEDIVPQTLDGALPMVLGVGEQGHFEFDHYQLRDEVKALLDELVVKLRDAEYDELDVAGFSDRIGDASYNKALSRRRALAVAHYLRDKGVPEHKIRVRGYGDERPVTKLEDCDGLRGEAKISCLQPDRRVEIAAFIRRMNVDLQ